MSAPRRSRRSDRTPAFFKAVADGTYDWESWMDDLGRLRWVNPAVERISGYSIDACFAMEDYPLPIVAPEDRPIVERVLATARAGGSGNDIEFRMLEPGTRRVHWGAISWQPFRGPRNEPLGFRTSVRDIDERKLAEARLRQAMVNAEQANRAKSEFLAIVSHELRTPLQTIAGYSDLLSLADLPRRELHYVRVLRQQNEALSRIVGDLLDLSSLQAHTLQLKNDHVDLRNLLAKIHSAEAPRARAKGLTLRRQIDEDVPRIVVGDDVRLREVLSNLIGNAVKFTEHGNVTVRMTSRAQGRVAVVTFTVTDTGIGIPVEDHPHLFTPFFQADSSTGRRFGGTGLGLAIAHRLVELMGGTIAVESAAGRGAAFLVSIPFVVETRLRAPARPRGAALADHGENGGDQFPPRRILLVDDSAAAREVGAELLLTLGRTVSVAASGAEALEKAAEQPFDVVLLDLQMPGLDGFEVARRLRAGASNPALPRPRVVALTASALTRRGEAAELFDAILQKPMRLADLATFLGLPTPTRAAPDDAAILDRLRSRFGPEARAIARAIRAAARGEDRSALAAAAHKAKGLALLVGARDAAKRAEALSELALRPRSRWSALTVSQNALLSSLRGVSFHPD